MWKKRCEPCSSRDGWTRVTDAEMEEYRGDHADAATMMSAGTDTVKGLNQPRPDSAF